MKIMTTLILLGFGLSSLGQIARADFFTFNKGIYSTLPVVEVFPHVEIGINNTGQIVGATPPLVPTGGGRGFLDTNGVITFFDVPGAVGTFPTGINNAGQIVGSTYIDSSFRGFVDTNGVFTIFDGPGGAFFGTFPTGINDLT